MHRGKYGFRRNMNSSNNTVWHRATISRAHRERLNTHRALVLWFTGFSGSGKSTLAHAVEDRLYHMNCRTFVLDGDNVRQGFVPILAFPFRTDRKISAASGRPPSCWLNRA